MGYFTLKSIVEPPSYLRVAASIPTTSNNALSALVVGGDWPPPTEDGVLPSQVKTAACPSYLRVAASIPTTSNKALSALVVGGGWPPPTEDGVLPSQVKTAACPSYLRVAASIPTNSNKALSALVVGGGLATPNRGWGTSKSSQDSSLPILPQGGCLYPYHQQ